MNQKMMTHVPLTLAEYYNEVERLIRILAELGIGIKKGIFKKDGMLSTELYLDNEVSIVVDVDTDGNETIAEMQRVDRVRYTVGVWRTTCNGWDPPDSEFFAVLETSQVWDALKEVLLQPKRWEIEGLLEAASLAVDRSYRSGIEGV